MENFVQDRSEIAFILVADEKNFALVKDNYQKTAELLQDTGKFAIAPSSLKSWFNLTKDRFIAAVHYDANPVFYTGSFTLVRNRVIKVKIAGRLGILGFPTPVTSFPPSLMNL